MPWDFAREVAAHGPHSPRRRWGLSASRAYCSAVAKAHYENFTVASLLLPRPLVPHFHAVYAYCRWSDDLADETAGGDTALSLLAWWRDLFRSAADSHPVLPALHHTLRRFAIPQQPFLDLIDAFEQDQRVTRYDTFPQLLDYCRRSANPVGRIVLHLFGCADDSRLARSDDICTGLQLANFWQDVARDWQKGRVYLPQEDLQRFGVSWPVPTATPAFRELLAFEVERTRAFFQRGSALLPLLPVKVRIDVELFLRGGEAILDAIVKQNYDVLTTRPTVSKWQKVKLLGRAVVMAAATRGGFLEI